MKKRSRRLFFGETKRSGRFVVSDLALGAILASFALLLAGCRSTPTPAPTVFDGRLPELEVPGGPTYLSEGSLYSEQVGAAQLIGDFRARHRGDVLTVRVTESALGSSKADQTLDKKTSNSLKAPVLFGYENKLKGKLGPDFDPALALGVSGEKSFEGEGETTRSARLNAAISVRVLAVGTGGRMLVAGSKEIHINNEKQIMTLAGIVRPEDVGTNNSIPSSAIADLRITYGGAGDVADVVRQGWFQRMLTRIWPF